MNPTVSQISAAIEEVAPLILQESYDNSGLLVGNPQMEVHSALLSLDVTEAVVEEAIAKKCNLIIAHHPLIFGGLKRLTGQTDVQRSVIKAIKNDIAIYACHTNLDNVLKQGVNAKIAEKLGLEVQGVLSPKSSLLYKLQVYVPVDHAEKLKEALFAAGAGEIGDYDECGFEIAGTGSFRPLAGANPFEGRVGQRHQAEELCIEVLVQNWKKLAVHKAMLMAHPYEEVAYNWIALQNVSDQYGSGVMATLPVALNKDAFLMELKKRMDLKVVKFTHCNKDLIEKVAICGGSGSFLIGAAKAAGADAYITADVKYHEFFEAENELLICDIGHYESEKYTVELFSEILSLKFPNFANIFALTRTNPIDYI